jgi:hypothetical protein
MASSSKTELSYAKLFAALGRFIEQKKIDNVCVMEFEGGVIVTGSALYETAEGYNRQVITHVLSQDDLQRMVKGG